MFSQKAPIYSTECWWHHDPETHAELLALCEENSRALQKNSNAVPLCLLPCYPECAAEQIVEVSMIKDAMTLMWHHCNDILLLKSSFFSFRGRVTRSYRRPWRETFRSSKTVWRTHWSPFGIEQGALLSTLLSSMKGPSSSSGWLTITLRSSTW